MANFARVISFALSFLPSWTVKLIIIVFVIVIALIILSLVRAVLDAIPFL